MWLEATQLPSMRAAPVVRIAEVDLDYSPSFVTDEIPAHRRFAYPISISAGIPSRPIVRRCAKCERSAARRDGCDV